MIEFGFTAVTPQPDEDERYPLNALVVVPERRTRELTAWVEAVLDDLDLRTEAAWRRRLKG